jgi:hypothetical protein
MRLNGINIFHASERIPSGGLADPVSPYLTKSRRTRKKMKVFGTIDAGDETLAHRMNGDNN